MYLRAVFGSTLDTKYCRNESHLNLKKYRKSPKFEEIQKFKIAKSKQPNISLSMFGYDFYAKIYEFSLKHSENYIVFGPVLKTFNTTFDVVLTTLYLHKRFLVLSPRWTNVIGLPFRRRS